jgi:diaminohydroxyphosphoribosylaminopyrimidine deaminase/5-amino-6-(5-phosphoribosylamino)uracil reductase
MKKNPPRNSDAGFMRLALREARKGVGRTLPNPAVGAIVVKNGRILSRGWHRAAGMPHAEIEAISKLAKPGDARGATLYVTLEPCSTQGRTPPCTSAIIAAGLTRVVFGAPDPNPKNAGRAEKILRKEGVEAVSGVLGDECAAINRAWNKWISTGMPFVTAKAGMSLDGRIASPPGRRWITSEAARLDAMRLRSECGAVLVGAETVRADNPHLTVRGGKKSGVQPIRAVWSRSGKLDPACHLLSDAFRDRTVVYKGKALASVLCDLGKRGVAHVLIEGGGRTLGEAFDKNLVDRIVFYTAPALLGGPIPAVGGLGAGANAEAVRLENPTYRLVGGCLRTEAMVAAAR